MQQFKGVCPVCQKETTFSAQNAWYRDHLLCQHCHSIPRERAFAWVLDRFCPNWHEKTIHESSPAARSISLRVQKTCKKYIGSQYYPNVPAGKMHQGYRSENLEALTFKESSIDLHLHLDVMEHVNRPDLCCREMYRTLASGGMAIFTVPVYKEKVDTQRRAIYFPDGVEHLAPPEYHGNPIDESGALVTYHYGQDFSHLIRIWTPGFSVCQILLNDAKIGVLGEFRDVFVLTKN